MEPETKELSRAAKGGIARAKYLSKRELSESGKKAAEARWGAELPQASHDGPLQIGDALLVAAVLPNGKRLLAQGTFLKALGRSRTPKGGTGGFTTVDGLPFFLQADVLRPFISEELLLSTTPILFRLKRGQRTVGYDAKLLPMVCRVYQDFRDSLTKKLARGNASEVATAKTLYERYAHIIAACDMLVAGFAQRGIEALVDDATGYRANRAKEDMLRVIAEYISPDLRAWTRRFPPEFFGEIYRIYGWEYKAGSIKHPQYVGKLINKYVYEPLPPGVLEAMKKTVPKNDSGARTAKLWQTLSVGTGIPHLDRQIADIYMMMRLSSDKDDLAHNFDKLYGPQLQLRFQVLKELPELVS
jgi:hypothetical protein